MATNKRWRSPRILPRHCLFVLARGTCANRAGHGKFGSFCEEHANLLARFREELTHELANTKRWGGSNGGRGSTCCTVGCYGSRVPPAAFCDACEAAGAVEEVA